MLVCAKNKGTLEELGILTPVPELNVLLNALDKGKTIKLAQKIGFPCPKTIEGHIGMDLSSVRDAFGPPWIIKPRTSAGSTGMAIVTDPAKLQDTIDHVCERYGNPLVQEYIPGSQRQNFYVMVDADGKIHYTVCPKILRYCRRMYRDSTASALSSTAHPWMTQVHDFVRSMNWRGALSFQTKIDARDGTPKLMEINAGVRAHNWFVIALGINVPLLCLATARNEKLPTVEDIPSNVLFLDPIQDLTGLLTEIADWLTFRMRTSLLRKKPTDRMSTPPGLWKLLSGYSSDYLSNYKKAYHPNFDLLARDPKPNLIAAYLQARDALWNLRKVGT